MYNGRRVKCRYTCQSLMALIFSTYFQKILKYQIFMKIHPVEAELFHANGRTREGYSLFSRFHKLA